MTEPHGPQKVQVELPSEAVVTESPHRVQVELPSEAVVTVAGSNPSVDDDDEGVLMERPDHVSHDSNVRVLRRMEDGLNIIRLQLYGIFAVELVSSVCLVFIIVYSLATSP